jgi:hypothetical protein
LNVSVAELLKNAEFWAALFGALAAFILGALGQWWANVNAQRTAGNLTLITLSQMYSLIENLRWQLLVEEPRRQAKLLGGAAPYEFQIRAVTGLPKQGLRIPAEQLGFLAESHDPDVLNRLMSIERAFGSILDLLERKRPSRY